MTEPASIAYRLGKYGWSSFTLTIGDARVDIGKFGYCTDALGDLVRAALVIAASGSHAEVSFDGEPHEWRLLIDREWGAKTSRAMCHVRVLTFANIGAQSPESEGDNIFDAQCDSDDFARAVETAAREVFEEHGIDGYNKAWLPFLNGFPLRGLEALRAALAVEEPPIASSR